MVGGVLLPFDFFDGDGFLGEGYGWFDVNFFGFREVVESFGPVAGVVRKL